MAFSITAQLVLQGPNNVKQIVSQIRSQLSNIKSTVDIKISSQSLTSIKDLNKSLNDVVVSTAKVNQASKTTNTTLSSSTGIKKATSDINDLTTSMEKFGYQSGLAIRRFAAWAAVTSVIFPLVSGLKTGFVEAAKFERQMVKVAQSLDMSLSSTSELQKTIANLAQGLGVSSAGLADISKILAQAGIAGKDLTQILTALAKTELSPSFEDIKSTTEGVIAMMHQFNIAASQVESQLSSIAAVAAKYAVESTDIVDAIRRTGGAFASAGGTINELIAMFTSVRQTTRESAESIATGFRTIFTRIQRGSTIEYLKQLGINLRDLEGNFVGPYEAVRRLSEALKNIPTTSPLFAAVVEELGGYRQISKVIPLIQQFQTAEEALGVAISGNNKLSEDAVTAQQSLLVQVQKLKEQFLSFIRVIYNDPVFKAMAEGALMLASAVVKLAESFKGLLPLMLAIGSVKFLSGATRFAHGFAQSAMTPKVYARGGLVPGHGDTDSVPAMLTPGEFVLKKSAVQAMGASSLFAMNGFTNGGVIDAKTAKAAAASAGIKSLGVFDRPFKNQAELDETIKNIQGNEANKATRQAASKTKAKESISANISAGGNPLVAGIFVRPEEGAGNSEDITSRKFGLLDKDIQRQISEKFNKEFSETALINLPIERAFIGPDKSRNFDKVADAAISKMSDDLANQLGSPVKTGTILDINAVKSIKGSIFESAVKAIVGGDAALNSDGFDFKNPGEMAGLAKVFNQNNMAKVILGDAKYSSSEDAIQKIKTNAFREPYISKLLGAAHMATGGSVSDTVPAMLTPGEFVFNRDAVNRIGLSNLHALNAKGYAKGGLVDPEKAKRFRSSNYGKSRDASGYFVEPDPNAGLLAPLSSSSTGLFDRSGYARGTGNAGTPDKSGYWSDKPRTSQEQGRDYSPYKPISAAQSLDERMHGEMSGRTTDLRGMAVGDASKALFKAAGSPEMDTAGEAAYLSAIKLLNEEMAKGASLAQAYLKADEALTAARKEGGKITESITGSGGGGKKGFGGKLKERLGGIGIGGALTAAAFAVPVIENVFGKSQATQVAGGTISGAAAGAGIGGILGPWGAAVGGAIGALNGFITAMDDAAKEIVDNKVKKALEDTSRTIDEFNKGKIGRKELLQQTQGLSATSDEFTKSQSKANGPGFWTKQLLDPNSIGRKVANFSGLGLIEKLSGGALGEFGSQKLKDMTEEGRIKAIGETREKFRETDTGLMSIVKADLEKGRNVQPLMNTKAFQDAFIRTKWSKPEDIDRISKLRDSNPEAFKKIMNDSVGEMKAEADAKRASIAVIQGFESALLQSSMRLTEMAKGVELSIASLDKFNSGMDVAEGLLSGKVGVKASTQVSTNLSAGSTDLNMYGAGLQQLRGAGLIGKKDERMMMGMAQGERLLKDATFTTKFKTPTTADDFQKKFAEASADLPKEIQDYLKEQLQTKIEGSGTKKDDVLGPAQMQKMIEEVTGTLGKSLEDSGKKLGDQLVQVRQRFADNVARMIEIQNKYKESQLATIDAQTTFRQTMYSLDEQMGKRAKGYMSVGEARGVDIQRQNTVMGTNMGADALNPAVLGARLRQQQQNVLDLEARRQQAEQTGGNENAVRALTVAQEKEQQAANDTRKALENLTKETQASASAQKDFNRLMETKNAVSNLGGEFLGADIKGKRNLQKSMKQAQVLAQGGLNAAANMRPEEIQAAIARLEGVLKNVEVMPGVTGGMRAEQLKQEAAQRFVYGARGIMAGVNPALESTRGVLNEEEGRKAKAQEELKNSITPVFDKFSKEFGSSVNAFQQGVASFAAAINGIPQQIQGTYNINVNGVPQAIQQDVANAAFPQQDTRNADVDPRLYQYQAREQYAAREAQRQAQLDRVNRDARNGRYRGVLPER